MYVFQNETVVDSIVAVLQFILHRSIFIVTI